MCKKIIFLLLLFLSSGACHSKIIQYSFNEQCKISSEIFSGKVVEIKVIESRVYGHTTFETFKIKFVCDNFWKGKVNDTLICIASTGICSPNIFELGSSYLIYSENGKISLGTGRSCRLNKKFAKKEMAKLSYRYMFRKPKKSKLITSANSSM